MSVEIVKPKGNELKLKICNDYNIITQEDFILKAKYSSFQEEKIVLIHVPKYTEINIPKLLYVLIGNKVYYAYALYVGLINLGYYPHIDKDIYNEVIREYMLNHLHISKFKTATFLTFIETIYNLYFK